MMRNRILTISKESGLTLIELMVALAIGIFLAGAVGTLYLNTRGAFDYSNEVARIEENGRFALAALSRDIRMAGYNGCGTIVPTYNVINPGSVYDASLDPTVAVVGLEGGQQTLPTYAAAGTDVITLKGAGGGDDVVIRSHNPSSAQFDTNIHSLQPGDVLMISDCSRATIFQMTGPTNNNNNATNIVHNTGTGTPGNCTKFLGNNCSSPSSYTYPPGSMITRLYTKQYFIGNSAAISGAKSLFVREMIGTNAGTNQELLTGVENMQIAYGRDTDGDGTINDFVTANSITDWTQVRAVRVSLLVRSLKSNLAVGNQPYTYMVTSGSTAESSVTGDGTLRSVFTETVSIRNRNK